MAIVKVTHFKFHSLLELNVQNNTRNTDYIRPPLNSSLLTLS